MRKFTMGAMCLLGLTLTLAGKDKPEKVYPEHGKVVGLRTERHTHGMPVYTDADGGVHGGGVASRRVAVYAVDVPGMEYEIEGKQLAIGDEVNCRVEKDKLFIQAEGKEHKYRIVGERLTSGNGVR